MFKFFLTLSFFISSVSWAESSEIASLLKMQGEARDDWTASMTVYSKKFANEYDLPQEGVAPLGRGMALLEFTLQKDSFRGIPQCYLTYLLEEEVDVLAINPKSSLKMHTMQIEVNLERRSPVLAIESVLPKRSKEKQFIKAQAHLATKNFIFDKKGIRGTLSPISMYVDNFLPSLNLHSHKSGCNLLRNVAAYSKSEPAIWIEKPQYTELLNQSPRPKKWFGYSKYHYLYKLPANMQEFILSTVPTGSEFSEIMKPYRINNARKGG